MPQYLVLTYPTEQGEVILRIMSMSKKSTPVELDASHCRASSGIVVFFVSISIAMVLLLVRRTML